MKEWRIYDIEELQDSIIFFIDENTETPKNDDILNGKDVVKHVYKSADVISVELISAAAIVDKVKNQIAYDKDYYIKLISYQSKWTVMSKNYYKKDEALKIASMFMDLNTIIAKKIWNLKGYGGGNVFFITTKLEN